MQGGFNIEQVTATFNQIEMKLRKIDQLRKLYEQTKVPIIYMIAGVIVLMILIVYVCSGLRAITNLVAFVYPAYMSIKAIKSVDKNDDTLWLAYWLWYGLFAVVESITDVLLFWVPMYELLKMGFYIFLYAPKVEGAMILYRKLIDPWLSQLEEFEQKFLSMKNNITSKPSTTTTPGTDKNQ